MLSLLSFSNSVLDLSPWLGATHIQAGSLFLSNTFLGTPSHLEMCFHGEPKSCQTDLWD